MKNEKLTKQSSGLPSRPLIGSTAVDQHASRKTLVEELEELRKIPAKWKELDDPLAELAKIRQKIG